MDKEYITLLLERYFSNEATHTEREALFAELEKYRNNEDWIDIHTQLLSRAEEIKDYNPKHYQSIIKKILAPKTKIIPIYRRRIFKWIAAAVVLIAIATTYTVISKRSGKSPATEVAKTHDVPAPKDTRAVITLADGRKVFLDSVNNGTIAQENNVNIVRNNEGEIQYLSPAGGGDLSASPNNKRPGVDYNTLFNPRGSKVISLTLSDGTKVWLNSESSLKYPIAFAGNTREVQITGEAYFEVKHNSKQPFKVHLPNGSIVEDIGTSFNINAYPDEDATNTTLIEGSVRVLANSQQLTANSQKSLILKPGEQAIDKTNSPLTIHHSPDIEQVLAWKNGVFEFGGNDLSSVMRQISRWYDVEIIYEGTRPLANFRGSISRTENIAGVLKMLELTKAVKFRVEGKKVHVSK